MRCSLVLSGGAVRGFYHFGVWRALREAGIRPSDISGCSAGALIGALAASEYDRDIDALVRDMRLASLIGISPGSTGFLSTKKIAAFLESMIPARRIEDLPIPLTINATDINTGEEVVFRKGPLLPALLASMAIPGVFPLVENEGRLLADGGIVDNLPLRHARTKTVIASDVTFPLHPIAKDSSRAKIMLNALLIGIDAGVRRSEKDARTKKIHLTRLGEQIFAGDLRKRQLDTLYRRGYEDGKRLVVGLRS